MCACVRARVSTLSAITFTVEEVLDSSDVLLQSGVVPYKQWSKGFKLLTSPQLLQYIFSPRDISLQLPLLCMPLRRATSCKSMLSSSPKSTTPRPSPYTSSTQLGSRKLLRAVINSGRRLSGGDRKRHELGQVAGVGVRLLLDVEEPCSSVQACRLRAERARSRETFCMRQSERVVLGSTCAFVRCSHQQQGSRLAH